MWGVSGSPLAVPAALAAGVLIDSDHIFDFYNWYVRKDRRRVFLLFHAWEYTALALTLALTVWHHPAVLAGVLGHLGHLVSDQLANHPRHPLGYSVIYRLFIGFDNGRIFPETPPTLSEALHNSIPLWGMIEPRLFWVVSRFSPGARTGASPPSDR